MSTSTTRTAEQGVELDLVTYPDHLTLEEARLEELHQLRAATAKAERESQQLQEVLSHIRVVCAEHGLLPDEAVTAFVARLAQRTAGAAVASEVGR